MGPLYKVFFKSRIENRRLLKKIDDLNYKIDYLEHHFDIGQMKPATGVLREFQLAEVEFSKYILDLLKPYNLQMYLEGGALLGAKRHKGFIPWDDDIDIAMSRADYNKLLHILQTDPNFVWIDTTQKTGYYSEYYDKLIRANANKNIVIRTPTCMHVYRGTCLRDVVNIEFFANEFLKEDVTEEQYLAFKEKVTAFVHVPHTWKELFDYYDENWEACNLYSLEPTSRIWAHIKDLNSEISCDLYPQDNIYAHHGLTVDLYRCKRMNLTELCEYRKMEAELYLKRKLTRKLMSEGDFQQQLPRLTKKIEDDEKGDANANVDILGFPFNERYMKYSDVFPLKRYSFENVSFWGPNNADAILKQFYGDYMQLPPEKNRVPHCNNIIIRK